VADRDRPEQTDLGDQARLEAGLRQVNERIDDISGDADVRGWSPDGLVDYRCECGRAGCQAWVRLTPEEYDRLRTQDDRFAVALEHETEGLEGVVERTDRFVVVDKLDQFEPLVADDPRGASSK
jgi:hypothetical protein